MIIVTGGAGFIGRNLIAGLNKIQQTNILIVDDLKNGKKYENLIGLHFIDYIDKSCFIEKLCTGSYIKKIVSIFHEGACTNTCEWDGQYLINNNYLYSKRLLEYSLKKSIPFIYASSASIYGKNTKIFYKTYQEQPINMYSYSKYLFDKYVQKILPKIKSQVCGLRYFNVYGPYEAHKKNMASIIYNLYEQIINNQNPTLFTGSKQFNRDFIYIDDIVKINLWAWRNKISGIFDCGTGIATSFQSIADIVLDFFKKKITLKYIPFPENLKKHYQIFTKANLLQLQKSGYQFSFINLNTGIYQYLNWLSRYNYNFHSLINNTVNEKYENTCN